MKKLALTSLVAIMSISAASAAEIKPYVGVNFGYEHAAYNDLSSTYTFSGEVFDGTDWVAASDFGTEPHMGNIAGDGITMGLTGGVEYNVTEWLGLRGEVEYMYSHENNANFDFKEGIYEEHIPMDIDTHTLLLNVYADFHNSTAFTPYVTAGLGYAWADIEQDSNDIDHAHIKDSGLAWQVGAGISYSMTDALSLDLGYRFVKLATISDKTSQAFDEMYEHGIESEKLEITPMMHQVRLGARYAF